MVLVAQHTKGHGGLRALLAAMAVGVGLGLALILSSLNTSRHESQLAERRANEAVRRMVAIDGLEWRAIAGEDPAELREALEQEIDALAMAAAGGEIGGRTAVYSESVQALFEALLAGNAELAEEIDDGQVDPAFEAAIDAALAGADAAVISANRADRAASLLSWLVSVGAGVLLAVGSWFLLATNERRERSRKAAEIDHRFRSLVKSSKDVFTVVSGDQNLVVMSDDLGPLRPFAAMETPRRIADLLPADQVALWAGADERVRTGGGSQHIELRVRRVDQTVAYIEAQGSSLTGSDSERVWVWRDISERKELELQLVHQAFHDALTGVANRALLQDRANHALSRSSLTGRPVSVLFCDLDDFKTINDSLGHDKGDKLLGIVTARLLGCVRDSDTVARLGGDEFAILLEDSGTESSLALAERILDVVRYEITLEGRTIFPSVSIGVATATVGSTTDQLLRDADTAMYVAKRAGKGRVEVFQNGMHDTAENLLEFQADLKQALDRDQLVLHYQPTIGLADGGVEGVEALVRWMHPTRGSISPDVFVPVAEATGMIIAIGRWVLQEACRTAHEIQREGCRPTLMHVNLSPQQLRDPTLVGLVAATLEESGLDPTLLVLEVTESTLLDDRSAIQRLHELKALGLQIAIDDFGTGYTSISYLQQLPIDILKIDRSFVSGGALPDDQRAAFLHAIVGLANSLGVHTVAEGIEQPHQLDELRYLGCASGQGFLWSTAVARGQLEDTLRSLRSSNSENV